MGKERVDWNESWSSSERRAIGAARACRCGLVHSLGPVGAAGTASPPLNGINKQDQESPPSFAC